MLLIFLIVFLLINVRIVYGESNVVVPEVSNIANPWTQCGGLAYSGPKSCPADYSCVNGTEWFSQCRPTTMRTSYSILSYQIAFKIANIDAQSFSNSLEAALMIPIQNIQSSIGLDVYSIEVTSNQPLPAVAISPSNQRLRGSQLISVSTNTFNIVISLKLYLDGNLNPSAIYSDSTSILNTTFHNGTLLNDFKQYIQLFAATGSAQAQISTMSFTNYQYKTHNSNTTVNDTTINLKLLIPIVLGAVIFVALIYCILYHHLEGDRVAKNIHRKQILMFSEKYLEERFHRDYNHSNVEDPTIMEFVSNSLVDRHGIDQPKVVKNKSPKQKK